MYLPCELQICKRFNRPKFVKNIFVSLTFTLCLNYYSKTNAVSFTFNTAFLPQLAEQSTTIFVSTMNEVRVDL